VQGGRRKKTTRAGEHRSREGLCVRYAAEQAGAQASLLEWIRPACGRMAFIAMQCARANPAEIA
jgi:hypothetical protein